MKNLFQTVEVTFEKGQLVRKRPDVDQSLLFEMSPQIVVRVADVLQPFLEISESIEILCPTVVAKSGIVLDRWSLHWGIPVHH